MNICSHTYLREDAWSYNFSTNSSTLPDPLRYHALSRDNFFSISFYTLILVYKGKKVIIVAPVIDNLTNINSVPFWLTFLIAAFPKCRKQIGQVQNYLQGNAKTSLRSLCKSLKVPRECSKLKNFNCRAYVTTTST